MSNEVVNYENELAKYAKQDAEKVTPSSSIISLRAGVITMNGNAAPENKMAGIIVASAVERAWYADPFDPDNVATPKCWGLGAESVEGPDELAESPQADSCATCPMNQWGSADRGKGKACKARVRLAVIPAGVKDAESVLRAEVAMMRVPVTSVKNWGNYVTYVAAAHKRPPFAVVTEISTKPDPKSQFLVTFNYQGDVDAGLTPALIEKRGLGMDVLLLPFEARQEGAPAPAAKGSKHKA